MATLDVKMKAEAEDEGAASDGSNSKSFVESGVVETPILETSSSRGRGGGGGGVARPLYLFSHSSSSHSSSSRSINDGSNRRFQNMPTLRRSLAQDSDPCMLAESYESWSDEEEKEEDVAIEEDETEEDQTHARRPSIQRSHTEKTARTPSLDGEMTNSSSSNTLQSMPPLSIRVKKFASTSALHVRPPSSDTLVPSPQQELQKRMEEEDTMASALEQGTRVFHPTTTARGLEEDDMLRGARFASSRVFRSPLPSPSHPPASPLPLRSPSSSRSMQPPPPPNRAASSGSDADADVNRDKDKASPPAARPPSPPPTGRRRTWLSPASSLRFRRWYGRILNSYFAFWLVICSLVVALLDLLVLLMLVVLRHEKEAHERRFHPNTGPTPLHGESGHGASPPWDGENPSLQWCHVMTRGSLNPIHYMGAAACVLLTLPVVVPCEISTLYKTRSGDRRMVRLPYLHLCELVVTAEVGFLLYFAFDQGYRLPFTLNCHREFTLAELTFLYATLLLWLVLWWQVVVFCRFLVHLKLQADAVNDAIHTSATSDWMRMGSGRAAAGRGAEGAGLLMGMGSAAARKRPTQIATFKKLLYRAAARGDATEVDKLLTEASAALSTTSEPFFAADLYATRPTLWLYAFAASTKNPLHIAAKRGHVKVVERLLREGFDANALDKVARINFNLGLLFKIATRLFIKTQDGFKSPLRAVLCSVLLPPLHGAVAAGHVEVVRLLIEKGGADVNLLPRASFYHQSALLAAIFLADDPQIVKLLVAHGANFLHVATTSFAGLASHTYATPLQRSALTLRSATTEYLLSCGADVALTPLHEAAAADNVQKIKRLLSERRPTGRGSTTKNSGGGVDTLGERVEGVQRRTPLHWAAVVGRVASCKLLLDRGANPNASDRYGRTPLHWAARNNHAEVVALLLSRGADATAEDHGGVPVLSFAAEADGVATQVIDALQSGGASLKHQLLGSGDTALHIALLRENRITASSLIRCGANLLAVNRDGKRAVDVTTSTQLQFDLKKEAGMRHVMLSYPHSHFAFAQRVREFLENDAKLTCWMDTMDPSGISGGAVWREEIARGIHNCAVVVSVVCEGYTESEWCLKELAFAKMARKPVIALMVDGGGCIGGGGVMVAATETGASGRRSSVDDHHERERQQALESLMPSHRRFPFHAFIKNKIVTQQKPRRVEFDVDDILLAAHWRAVLPHLKDAIGGSGDSKGKGKGARTIMGGRLSATTDSEPEQEEAEDMNTVDSQEEHKTEEEEEDHRAPSQPLVVAAPPPSLLVEDDKQVVLSVAVYSNVEHSTLRDRLVRDLSTPTPTVTAATAGGGGRSGRAHYEARELLMLLHHHENDDEILSQRLATCDVLVIVLESLGVDATSEQRRDARANLTALLRVAVRLQQQQQHRTRRRRPLCVVPIVSRANFLSFSNLYTLARSDLLYFVQDVAEKPSMGALMEQLKSHVAKMERKRRNTNTMGGR